MRDLSGGLEGDGEKHRPLSGLFIHVIFDKSVGFKGRAGSVRECQGEKGRGGGEGLGC